MRDTEESVNKIDGSTITYENIRRVTMQKPLSPKPKTTINLNRKHSTVLEKIHQLFEILWNLGYQKMISQNDMVFMIRKYCGGNRGTVRAYLGHTSYGGSSKYGNKHVTNVTKGFLEGFGYAKRYRGSWILFHKNIPRSYHYVENLPVSLLEDMNGSEGNMEKISLSQVHGACVCNSVENGETKGSIRKKEEEDSAREINFRAKKHIGYVWERPLKQPSKSGIDTFTAKSESKSIHHKNREKSGQFGKNHSPQLTKRELAVFNAIPFEHGEPDRSKPLVTHKKRKFVVGRPR